MSSGVTIGGKWLEDLNADLAGSDRSCAVLAAAVLDDRLARLLEANLVPAGRKGEDKLLGRGGAIESFSSRIELAYRMGLLSENVRKSLDWIREIRNEAAHRTEFSFEADGVRSRVENVIAALELRTRYPRILESPYNTPKGHCVATTVILAGMLEAVASGFPRPSNKPAVDMALMQFRDPKDGDEG